MVLGGVGPRCNRPGRGDLTESVVSKNSVLLQPLAKRLAGEQIAERLITAIALGQFVRGQRLPPERELAEVLGVSRASVRDAFAELVDSGYIEVRRGRSGGAYVKAGWIEGSEAIVRRVLLPRWDHLAHLLDVRCGVESQIARSAALRRTSDEADGIRAAAADYCHSGADRAASKAADLALHSSITRAAHNPIWEHLSVELRHEVSFGFGVEPFSAEMRRRAETQHPELADAVAGGHAELAAELAAEHFRLTTETITGLLADLSRSAKAPSSDTDPYSSSKGV